MCFGMHACYKSLSAPQKLHPVSSRNQDGKSKHKDRFKYMPHSLSIISSINQKRSKCPSSPVIFDGSGHICQLASKHKHSQNEQPLKCHSSSMHSIHHSTPSILSLKSAKVRYKGLWPPPSILSATIFPKQNRSVCKTMHDWLTDSMLEPPMLCLSRNECQMLMLERNPLNAQQ